MTQKYKNLEEVRNKLCARRKSLQEQINLLDEIIHEIHNEMELELGLEKLDCSKPITITEGK